MSEIIATFFKENWVKTVSAAVTGVFAMFAAMWGFTSHFASAAELSEVKNEVKTFQKSQSLDLQIQLNKQSLRDMNGKVADIEDKKKVSEEDKTKKQRLQRGIADLSKENEILMEQKFKIENGK